MRLDWRFAVVLLALLVGASGGLLAYAYGAKLPVVEVDEPTLVALDVITGLCAGFAWLLPPLLLVVLDAALSLSYSAAAYPALAPYYATQLLVVACASLTPAARRSLGASAVAAAAASAALLLLDAAALYHAPPRV